MRKVIRNLLDPIRKFVARFVNPDGIFATSRWIQPIELAAEFMRSENVQGDYLEFGVFRGDSFIDAYHKIERTIKEGPYVEMFYKDYSEKWDVNTTTRPIRYFAFDSFEGLPETKDIDKHPLYSKGRYACSVQEFQEILKSNKVDNKKVVLVPGYYDKTLNADTKKRFELSAASIVMVDCDLYESAKLVLDFITDLVVDGTIIIFDDWFAFKGNPNLGEQRACREWLDKNPNISLAPYGRWGPWQASFVVSKKHTD